MWYVMKLLCACKCIFTLVIFINTILSFNLASWTVGALVTKKYISIISFIITIVAVTLMLGIFQASSLSHAMFSAENNFMWMVFLMRLFFGIGLEVARVIVSLTIISSCVLFYWMIRHLLIMTFIDKKESSAEESTSQNKI